MKRLIRDLEKCRKLQIYLQIIFLSRGYLWNIYGIIYATTLLHATTIILKIFSSLGGNNKYTYFSAQMAERIDIILSKRFMLFLRINPKKKNKKTWILKTSSLL